MTPISSPSCSHWRGPPSFHTIRIYGISPASIPAYCLVWLDTEETEQARFIRAFLRHPEFNTRAKRLGKVVRVYPDGLTCYDSPHGRPKRIAWLGSV